MAKIFDRFNRVVEILCNSMLGFMTLLVGYVVFMRYIMNDSPVWGEELVRLLLVWLTFLGASLGLKDDTHIRLSAIDEFLSPFLLKVLDWFSILVLFLFSLFMIIEGIKMTELSMGSTMPGLGIKTAWLLVMFPISGALNMIQLINKGRSLL